MAPRIERVRVELIKPLVDEFGNEFVSRDYNLKANKEYVEQLAGSFGPGGEPDEPVKLIRDGDCYRIKAGNSRVRAMQQLGTEECWAVIDDVDTVQSVVETVVRTNVKKKYEPVEESRFTQQLAMFGDDEYVGDVASIGAEKAASLRRGRVLAGDKAEQFTLDRLYALSEFEGMPEMVDEIVGASEKDWYLTVDRLRRRKKHDEDEAVFRSRAAELRIEVVDEYPRGLHYINSCEAPDDLEGAYMQASVTHTGIVGRLADNWSGVYLDFYGEPIASTEGDEAEAERRRLAARHEEMAKAVDDAMWDWVCGRFDEVPEGTLPSDFKLLYDKACEAAWDNYWLSELPKKFPWVLEIDGNLMLFAIGYSIKDVHFRNNSWVMTAEKPQRYAVSSLEKALLWADLHVADGWEPLEGMAEFMETVRSFLDGQAGDEDE